MLDIHAAKDRAVHLAVLSGHMPNFDLIHARQRTEGFEDCFGRCVEDCQQLHCRWYQECMALVRFDLRRELSEDTHLRHANGEGEYHGLR